MADVFDKKKRGAVMALIRGRDTGPELVVRKFLYSRGLRYRLHCPDLPGRPDIVFRRFRSVVFVHGCFWHQHSNCRYAVLPKSNRRFWLSKLKGNHLRDLRNEKLLRQTGWRVFTIWECALGESGLDRLYRRIIAASHAVASRKDVIR